MLKLATRATLLHATDMFSSSPRCALLLVRCSTNTAAGRWSSHRALVPQRCIASSVSVYQASPSSTSSEQSSSQQPSPSPPGAWNKLKTMIKAFTNGSKLVYKDFKRMREIKGRAKGFFPLTAEKLQQLSSGEAVSPITREEFVFMINTSRDVRRVLPTVVLFCIPVIGYFAPVLAFAFPQYLLSSHFLTEEQKVEVVRKGLARRRQSMEHLMQSVERVAQGAKLHEMDPEAILQLCRTKLHLSKVSSAHLRTACGAWGFTSLLPPLLPLRRLHQQLGNIYIADLLTKVEGGVQRLSEDEVAEACKSRCLLDVDAWSHLERAAALETWVADTTARGLKHSYLCHLPLWVTRRKDDANPKTISYSNRMSH